MTEKLIPPLGGRQVTSEIDFDNCTIKYQKNSLGKVNSIRVIFPKTQDADGNDTWVTFGVPLDGDNRHYHRIQEWVEKGNTIEEAD